MLRRLHQHRLVGGCAEIMADVLLYLGAMLVLLVIVDQLIQLAAGGG